MLVVCEQKTLNYIQSITALLIIRYYILVAEVSSCLSSAGNTVETEFLQGYEDF